MKQWFFSIIQREFVVLQSFVSNYFDLMISDRRLIRFLWNVISIKDLCFFIPSYDGIVASPASPKRCSICARIHDVAGCEARRRVHDHWRRRLVPLAQGHIADAISLHPGDTFPLHRQMDPHTWCIVRTSDENDDSHLPAILCRLCNDCNTHISPQTVFDNLSRSKALRLWKIGQF